MGREVDNPYTFSSGTAISEAQSIPDIDIYNNTPSSKLYKSLEGCKYLLAGWVGDVSVHVACCYWI